MGQIVLGMGFVIETCIKCGITYSFTNDFYEKRRKDHESFFCPNGHSQYYSGKSDKEKLEEKLAQEICNVNYYRERSKENYGKYEAEKRSKAAHKAHYTRLKKKIKKGQCPCCNKLFPDVVEHIKSVHPDYNKKMRIKKNK